MNELDIETVLGHVYKRIFGATDYDMHHDHLLGVLFDKMERVMAKAKTREQAQANAAIIIKKWCRQCTNESVTLCPKNR
jgi:hypothetical protein